MTFPALDNYLTRLHRTPQAGTRVWLDADGRAQGRYFHSTLTSAFQPIYSLVSGNIIGFEGFARSYSEEDDGLCLWKLLDHAANDDESIELDRLCRMLHAINYYRQPEVPNARLFLSVHARLLAAVDSNHGIAFRRVLDALDLPYQKIVLQLPLVTHDQGWLLNYVTDNYRRNGFRLAIHAADAAHALVFLDRVRPDFIKLDGRRIDNETAISQLLLEAAKRNVGVIFKCVEDAATVAVLRKLGAVSEQSIHAQGFFWGLPNATLVLPITATPPVDFLRKGIVVRQVGSF
jgi:EAL domain-containing protein (putative c-di-GMP-specific phosphodiesterase class I)